MLPLIAAGIGVAGGIGKLFARGKANRDLKSLMKDDPTYSANPLADQRLSLARTLLNSRMPGSVAMERNIYNNQANTVSNFQRGATSSADFLSNAGMAQGMTNNAFEKLAFNEANDYQRRYGNTIAAEEAVIGEGDKVFNDQTRRFGNKVGMTGQINANRQNSWQEVSNLGFSIADYLEAKENGQGGQRQRGMRGGTMGGWNGGQTGFGD